MPDDIEFQKVAPVVPVLDLQAAIDRCRSLGFTGELHGSGARYGFASRGDVSLHLSEGDEHDPTSFLSP